MSCEWIVVLHVVNAEETAVMLSLLLRHLDIWKRPVKDAIESTIRE